MVNQVQERLGAQLCGKSPHSFRQGNQLNWSMAFTIQGLSSDQKPEATYSITAVGRGVRNTCPLHTEAWGRGWDKFASTYHTLLHMPCYLGAGGCLPLRSWSLGSHADGSTFLLATRDSKVTLYRARRILGIQCIVGKWILQQIQRWKTTARELLTSQPCFKNRPPIKNGKWGVERGSKRNFISF